MDWISIALGAWLAAILVSILWGRASDSEKTALGKYPAGARGRLFLPGPWKSRFQPEDVPGLTPLRRKSLLTLALVVLVPLLLFSLRSLRPGEEGTGARQAVRTGPETPAGPLETTPDRKAADAGPADAAPGDAGAPPAAEGGKEEGPRTVVGEGLFDPEAPMTLAQSRTPTRLYGTAKVRPVYDTKTGEVNGVRIKKITPGSFWERIGARSGDIIIQFNGQEVDGAQATVNLMNAISRGKTLRLLVRDNKGRNRILNFEAPE